MESNKYIGKGDAFSFGKQKSFAGEHMSGLQFGFDIKNETASDVVIALCPAGYVDLAGIQKKFANVQALLGDGAIITIDTKDVTVTPHDAANTVDEMLAFIKNNPTRVVGLDLDSDTKLQFNKEIIQQKVSPFGDGKQETIKLRKFVSADQNQTDRAEIDLLANGTVLEFMEDSVILVTVVANSTFSWNMDIGAVYSATNHLRRRAAIATHNLAVNGNSPRRK